jgi:hypothetical protein
MGNRPHRMPGAELRIVKPVKFIRPREGINYGRSPRGEDPLLEPLEGKR